MKPLSCGRKGSLARRPRCRHSGSTRQPTGSSGPSSWTVRFPPMQTTGHPFAWNGWVDSGSTTMDTGSAVLEDVSYGDRESMLS